MHKTNKWIIQDLKLFLNDKIISVFSVLLSSKYMEKENLSSEFLLNN